MERTLPTRYSATAQLFHWLTAILVLIAFTYGPGGSEDKIYSAARDFDRQLHETLGLIVLTLTVLRLLWYVVDTRPAPTEVEHWMKVSAKAVKAGLYILLFALPFTAISGAWLEGHDLTLLGGVKFSPLLDKSHDLGAKIAEVHSWLGDAILWLAGLHAAAALYHHYMLKDRTLRSMLPLWVMKDRE